MSLAPSFPLSNVTAAAQSSTCCRCCRAHLPEHVAYSAAKAAAWALTDALRQELAPRGIHVASLHVGYMDTDMVSYVPADQKIDPAMVATLAREQAGSRRTFCSCNPSGAGSADCGEYVRRDLLHGRLLRRDSSSYPVLNSMCWWHCPFS
jgi:NAD(P)-dependent dehydrogenase (short-subunit alcohol dehydrogenase family)